MLTSSVSPSWLIECVVFLKLDEEQRGADARYFPGSERFFRHGEPQARVHGAGRRIVDLTHAAKTSGQRLHEQS